MNAAPKTCNCGTAKKLAWAALLLTGTIANAEELGRLFFTQEQRAQMEYGKLQHIDFDGGRRVLTVNGIVQKRGGARTVWINGLPQPGGVNDDRAPESQLISTPVQSQPAKVKVGQRVLINPPASEK